VYKNGSLMLSFGRSGSSWGKMTLAGSSWGEKVITPNNNNKAGGHKTHSRSTRPRSRLVSTRLTVEAQGPKNQ
jgi:hypothetical protein